MAQVWLITGSARGLGRAIAEAVLAADDKLIATTRNPQQLSNLVERYGDNVRAVALDVTDERAAIAAVQLAVDVFGRLDVLVNNAGYGNLAAIEDTTIQDFRAQLETNLFGVVNLTKAAIPVMRRQGAGRILQFSSVGGRVGPIGRGAYADAAGQTSNPASQSSSTGGRADLISRTWLITGASSGLGYALAELVLQRGDRVVLAARSMNSMSGLAARYQDRALAIGLDVTQPPQRIAAVERAQAHFGGIDVLVNNAGIDFLGAVEEQREEDYRAQFEVNFFGAVAMLRLVLPGMRRRQSGTIVNISSMDGIASLPVNGYYASSKFALEGVTESLWQEIEPIGLRAFLVELGSFRTGIEQRTRFSGEPIEAYEATSGAFRKMMTTVSPDMFPGDPVRAAAAIYEVVASESPRHWVVLGSDAQRRIGAKLDMLRAEFDAGAGTARSTDYPGSAKAIL